ncbi:carbohydrate ABC transporter permease [Tepidiforma thermophila]|mgnify:FL=1|uniref:Carbohydrate ABC transporter membrane protein 2 (CUT1 family) n=1 Tax=Tepidiforma thermophila (strain KCTC 52669 / CGMCC 1.13589 / G233) TaxID=2761530 RepID=A0A2A9HIK4_TEPT2|nr:carbohydrate ABC transporter permease [Tepidiforma thermophila]PFG75223.1 carbohydrate ABC transporter membrane protein 2 (CUT1 family) [Tepidiforma thermophila]
MQETIRSHHGTRAAHAAGVQVSSRLSRVAAYVAVIVAVGIIVLPLIWMLTASVKTRQEIYTLPVSWWPETFRWENYRQAWTAVPFERFFINSLVTTSIGSALELVNGVLTAYALVFLPFPKKNLIFLIVIAALMVPFQVTIIPNYVLVADLGWVNTYQGIIIPGAAVAFGAFLMRQQFLSLPREIIEAARIDGAGHLRILWQIVLPMSRPALVTFALISIVAKWNEYLWPLLVTNDANRMTLPVGLTQLQHSEGSSEWGVVMAGAVMVITPVLLVFLWAQRHIVEGLTSGSVKG